MFLALYPGANCTHSYFRLHHSQPNLTHLNARTRFSASLNLITLIAITMKYLPGNFTIPPILISMATDTLIVSFEGVTTAMRSKF